MGLLEKEDECSINLKLIRKVINYFLSVFEQHHFGVVRILIFYNYQERNRVCLLRMPVPLMPFMKEKIGI